MNTNWELLKKLTGQVFDYFLKRLYFLKLFFYTYIHAIFLATNNSLNRFACLT